MLLGAAIHGAYLATRSLWVAIAVHAANNGVAVIHENQAGFPILSPFEDVLGRGSAEVAVFFLASLFLLTAVGFALWQTRCKLVSTIPGLEPWQPEGGGMELPPPKSPTVVAHEPLSATSGALIAVAAIGFGLMITCL